jgi:hypothetical protein
MGAVEAHQHPESPSAAVRESHLITRHEVRMGQAHLRRRRIPPFRHRVAPLGIIIQKAVSSQPCGSPPPAAGEATGSVAASCHPVHGAIPDTTSRGTA